MSTPKKSEGAATKLASSVFQPAQNNQAHLKMGLLGFGGAGKSRTSFEVAAGLVELLSGKRDKLPILYTDSETGSDFFKGLADARGIPLLQQKTRAFDELMLGFDEAKRLGGVWIVDSITHFWIDLTESYMASKKRSRLYFQDWGPIKKTWGEFSTRYVIDPSHIIMAGRAAYEYDFTVDGSGEKQLEKTGTKMKAEGEMGYEPSLLVEMVREPKGEALTAGAKAGKKKVAGQLWDNVAYVLKDRWGVINGARFKFGDDETNDKVFASFLPHISKLNLGGKHFAFDASHNSQARFENDPEKAMARRITSVKIALEEIPGLITATVTGSTAAEKAAKAEMLYKAFGTRSWTAVENMRLEQLTEGYGVLQGLCAEYAEKAKEPVMAGASK